ncbi:hypothetical protein G6L46_10355 [Agrobacterium rhizogenes]|uniref:hypothetical protein n=1 Tax=Rhizobium rhizogenes TaxID=359 RepID=UPI001574E2A8|nr:hypothetical protein [Rhizobium rhizogenes]NTF87525.1 hypothetical protein [Rhizobium rhizogenes]
MNRFTPFLPAGAPPELRDLEMPRMRVSTQRRIEFILLAIIVVALPLAIILQVRP